MPEKPVPEQDPITSKSYAAHYVIATIILIATLFWALWDEAWGQRPWKAFQEQWKTRYSCFPEHCEIHVAEVGKTNRERLRLCNSECSLEESQSGLGAASGRDPQEAGRCKLQASGSSECLHRPARVRKCTYLRA